ncbi:acyl-CoA desaturase [Aspergillus clavatus NRRL 1]|uniref:Acyl-CoA desaturase n=1 Tax=Aspergillus clavatus (strain ATCC 1007 / CBS 513.65 / DSM 816 / NCTC 3887 / NRRL 1 / QM 1276 / 107) TaxID=344612 RepID=A1CQ94_ASPCL|nr:fatty acid desaturase family protein [Aspergillus clavatus NRRL 1]EAW07815.1 fatty acid desaturase family protein [Aspergillus clavatus NRRL 1]
MAASPLVAAADGQRISKKPHITETPIAWANWYRHVNWLNVFFIIVVPLMGFAAAYSYPLQRATAVFAVIYYFNTGLGITAGYHRLWAHSSYRASTPLKIYLAAVGVGAVQGSIRWWSRGHRAHHRYTDTERDPYSVRKGFWYSHLGWMVMKQNPKNLGRADITDLNEDPVVIWQHRHYIKAVLLMGLIFPTLVCGIGWGDWLGGFIYAGILRATFVQQATFCVNSLAHCSRSDYRNAIEWWQYDPTKWAIWTWKQLGLAYNLKEFKQNEIQKGRLQQQQKKLDIRRSRLDWGTPISQLPVMTWGDFKAEAAKGDGRALVAITGVVHDVARFIKDHPGGKAFISSAIGKDATATFNGGVYQHSNAAHNLLSTMRVGVIYGGGEVEIWKRAHSEKPNGSIMQDNMGHHTVRAGEQVTKVAPQNGTTTI